MSVAFTATEWKSQADQAGQSIDKYMASIATYETTLASLHNARSASPEDRERITATAEGMNGNILDASVEDLLSRSDVRRVQGTAAFARHTIKRLRLQYQPQD